jgi:hypothetical protein
LLLLLLPLASELPLTILSSYIDIDIRTKMINPLSFQALLLWLTVEVLCQGMNARR